MGAKVLVVDDSDSLRTQLKKCLQSIGLDVVDVGDGLQGLDALSKNPDLKLIICDVNMPNMDGITMVTKVSENDTWKAIPIFMLTTETNTDLKDKGKQAGVKAWITKPFQEDKLLLAVRKMLGMG